MDVKKEVIDQTAHVMAAVVILTLFNYGGLIGALVSGASIGLVREITEEGETVTGQRVLKALQSYKDLIFWGLGGVIAKLITVLV